jgi:hypothetical protein
MAIQLHLVVKFEVPLLDSLLVPHPEDPAIVDRVRIPVMEATITFVFNPIRPKHGMPFRQLDSAFFYQELKQLISFGDVKVVCALGLFDPALVHGQRLLAPHDLSGSYLLIIVGIFHLVGPFQKLIVDIGYVVLLAEPGVLLKPIGLVAHQ